jgi:hypothetical protein
MPWPALERLRLRSPAGVASMNSIPADRTPCPAPATRDYRVLRPRMISRGPTDVSAECPSLGLRLAARRGEYSHMRSSAAARAYGLGRPVWVKLEALFIQQGNGGVLREKDDDLVLTGEVPGKLDSWARAGRGEWLGVVSFEVTTRAGDSCTWERQLVPAYALRPRSYGAYPPGSRPRYPSGQTVDPTAGGPTDRLAAPDPVV